MTEPTIGRNPLTPSRLAAATCVLSLVSGLARAQDPPRWADYFGFLPVEVYKLDDRIGNLLVGDLDGDKTDDVIVANNARSRIDLLLSTKGNVEEPPAAPNEPNQVSDDKRMRRAHIPVNKEIVSIQLGDFNSDGKLDVAYYGTPAELIVLINQGGAKFEEAKHVNTGEAVESAQALAVGDLNRDGKDDLALLSANEVVTVLQLEGGKLADPERMPHSGINPRMVRLADMDGEGGQDLVLLEGSTDDPIRIRFSTPDRILGPEERFKLDPLRAYAFGQFDGKPGIEFLTIEAQSGRARIHQVSEVDDADEAKRGRLLFYPLPAGNSRGRSLTLGDLDGDGKNDIVVSDPANSQFVVYRQAKTGLGVPKTYPSLAGARTVRATDIDGDKKAEVYVLSEQEKQIGRSVLAGDRLTFPAPLPISGEPVSLETADIDGDKIPEIVYVTRGTAAGSTADVFHLRALKSSGPGAFSKFAWGEVDSVLLKDVTDPPAIKVADVNRDGLADILSFGISGPKSILLGRAGQAPTPAPGGIGPLSDIPVQGISEVNIGGSPALVVAQKTFARDLLLDKQGHWVVRDQFDSGRASAQLLGAAALDTDGDGQKEIVLLDRSSKSLLYLAKKDGVFRPSGAISVGAFDFQGMRAADLDGDGREDLLLAGADRFGVVLTGRTGRKFKTIASYEATRREARLSDLIVGDLNDDGRPDVALADPGEHFIEIVTATGQANLPRAAAFKIFEGRGGRRGFGDLIEPRDMGIGDVDGDRRSDLVLIVHDRLLIYRQDSGEAKDKVAEASKPVKP